MYLEEGEDKWPVRVDFKKERLEGELSVKMSHVVVVFLALEIVLAIRNLIKKYNSFTQIV